MNIVKFLSYEERTVDFVQVCKKDFQRFEKEMGSKVIRKKDFERAVSNINRLLIDIHNSKVVYKKIKSERLKEHIGQDMKRLSSNKKEMKSIVEMNRNYYNTIWLPKLVALCEKNLDI